MPTIQAYQCDACEKLVTEVKAKDWLFAYIVEKKVFIHGPLMKIHCIDDSLFRTQYTRGILCTQDCYQRWLTLEVAKTAAKK